MSGLLLAKVLHEHHFNVMIYDSRAHGESGGKYCTYGYYEKHDVQVAIYEAQKKYATGKIGVSLLCRLSKNNKIPIPVKDMSPTMVNVAVNPANCAMAPPTAALTAVPSPVSVE